ncbi:LysR family transcriptional regulator [Trinickia dinghuensis]|uniref:LysR family transcriptional regulator n=1 Tax=Trinickia dinghuensis TaxID=2291023 RepID=A0A3D8K6D6_9BURK|nr:LysR family transcriptional regulator [Trinickia dinghuensis]RDV00623.1 LysR family transcriptional regulator [Trinickia dinghuensis]
MEQPDLNALYVIEALDAERSVSRAADRLGLTQPAVSHALGRLRETFQDDLFVRAGSVMAPTPVGEKVIEGTHRALAIARQEIWQVKSFEAATTTRTFTVCLSDMGVIVLLPKLLAALHKAAPNATLRPLQVPSMELASALQDGDVDLAIGYLGRLGENLHQQSLFTRPLVGIIRGGKARKTVKMSPERFMESRHVVSSTLALTNRLLEKELRRHGKKLKVGVDVPYILAVPGLVANSDYIAIVPEELAALFSRLAAVDVFPLPLPLEDVTVQQFWHARYHNDAGHRWFRALVAETLRQ